MGEYMKNKNTINKILSVFIALLMIFSVSTVSSIKSFADEVLAKKVHVIIQLIKKKTGQRGKEH